MPVHDWAHVSSATFHDFHMSWNAELKKALNAGLLPRGYYAQVEQHVGGYIADVPNLQAGAPELAPGPGNGPVALAAPPRVSTKLVAVPAKRGTRRTIAIRHSSGHRVVALIEIVSTANKDRAKSVKECIAKAQGALQVGCHLLILDLLPPGRYDSRGMHAVLWKLYDRKPYHPPSDQPLTLAAYLSKPLPEAYVEHVAVGSTLPDMPLFLTPERHVNLPLGRSYMAAYDSIPSIWRDLLDGRSEQTPVD